jgi:nanoRNase/pAp phosphatase (c-di-AMP/oligoRNAs hydrolase)
MFFMLKYDHQLIEVKTRLPAANRILIVLPQNLNTDNLAAGLSLYLSLKSAGKKVDIVSTGTPLVSQSNLFGIGEVRNHVAKAGAGNFIISLDGVVDNTGTMQQVPALEKLDWYPEGSKLNLVFHVVPGQRFEPSNITSRHEEAGYDLTWVIGCQSLNELGDLFISNSQYFAQSQVINIDNNQINGYYGFANIVDPQASSLSEIVAQVLPSLTLNMDKDVASNIITGIYGATNNLTQKINPDTFMVVSQAVQVGGTLPNATQPFGSAQGEPVSDQAQQVPPPEPARDQPVASAPQADITAQTAQPFAQPIAQPVPQPTPPVAESSVIQPQPSLQGSPFIVPPQDINIPMPTYQPETQQVQSPQPSQPQFQFSQPAQADGQVQSASAIPQANAAGFDLRQIFQIPQMPSGAQPSDSQSTTPPPVPTVEQMYQPSGGNPEMPHESPQPQQKPDAAKASSEERPMGEFAHSPNPEMESTPTPDWLVPKIFKGGNLG